MAGKIQPTFFNVVLDCRDGGLQRVPEFVRLGQIHHQHNVERGQLGRAQGGLEDAVKSRTTAQLPDVTNILGIIKCIYKCKARSFYFLIFLLIRSSYQPTTFTSNVNKHGGLLVHYGNVDLCPVFEASGILFLGIEYSSQSPLSMSNGLLGIVLIYLNASTTMRV